MKSVSLIYSKEWLEGDALMEGVEVLNIIHHTTASIVDTIIYFILGIGTLLAIIYGVYWVITEADYGFAGVLLSTLGVVLFIMLCFGIRDSLISPKDTTYYQVIIDDSVSMVEFNEKYDIVEVEGKIYTIKEKVN